MTSTGLISVFWRESVQEKWRLGSSHHFECCNILWRCAGGCKSEILPRSLRKGFSKCATLPICSPGGKECWILKGFQREVIHNFDDISAHRGAGVHVGSNPVNGALISNLYCRISQYIRGYLLPDSVRKSF